MQACVAKSSSAASIAFSLESASNGLVLSNSTILMNCEKFKIRSNPIVTILSTLFSYKGRTVDGILSTDNGVSGSCGASLNTPWTVIINESISTDSLLEVRLGPST